MTNRRNVSAKFKYEKCLSLSLSFPSFFLSKSCITPGATRNTWRGVVAHTERARNCGSRSARAFFVSLRDRMIAGAVLQAGTFDYTTCSPPRSITQCYSVKKVVATSVPSVRPRIERNNKPAADSSSFFSFFLAISATIEYREKSVI